MDINHAFHLYYNVVCGSSFSRSQPGTPVSSLRKKLAPSLIQYAGPHHVITLQCTEGLSWVNIRKKKLSRFDLDVFPSHIHKLPAAKPVGRVVSIFHHTSKSPFSCSSKVSLQGKRNSASTPVGLFSLLLIPNQKQYEVSFGNFKIKKRFSALR